MHCINLARAFLIHLALFSCGSTSAQVSPREMIRQACEDGAKLFSKVAKAYAMEALKIASETTEGSPERVRRFEIHRNFVDDFIGESMARNRKLREDWISKGIGKDYAEIYWSVMDNTVHISIGLAHKNMRWDANRIALETEDYCKSSHNRQMSH
jgi:hypothetical protein